MADGKRIVIIGSGIGGLVVGNLLARKGHRVTIFESHSAPGGYTAGFRRKGFYFESGTFSFEASGTVFKAMRDLGVLDKVEFVPQRLRVIAEGLDVAPGSLAEFKGAVCAAFPGDRARLEQFFLAVDEMLRAMGDWTKPMPVVYDGWAFRWALLSFIVHALRRGRGLKKYDGMTAGEFAGQYFEKDSVLYRLLSGMGYPDMVAWMVGGFLAMFNDYWTVKGGMQSWADALAERFRQLGGELRLNACVDKILTRDGAAVGVACGRETMAADVVISASDYKKTMLKLLDDPSLVPEELRSQIGQACVSDGICTVYLGLNMPNDELRGFLKVPSVTLMDDQPGVDIHNADDPQFFEKTSVILYSPSLHNAALAPEGKSSLMIQAMAPTRWMGNWGGGDLDRYRQLKEDAKRALIAKAAKVIPGLRDRIEYEDAATPLTYERFTHNTDGATSGWSWHPRRRFYPQMLGAKIDTPVRNLYIGCSWACQLGGVPGATAAAYLCAKRIG